MPASTSFQYCRKLLENFRANWKAGPDVNCFAISSNDEQNALNAANLAL